LLPRLRPNLDFFPSPVEERPGLVIRDPYQYTDATLIIPPALVQCLEFFDGERTDLDLREYLVQVTGDLQVGDLQQHLVNSLSTAGFLEDETFSSCKQAAEKAFAESPVRAPVHAGGGYPEDPAELAKTLRGYLDGGARDVNHKVLAIAAPHVSPFGGVASYRAAYSALSPADADRTFVILGTSHYGAPERFGLTRKAFVTPFGETSTNLSIVNELAAAAPGAVLMEDYCHAIEHSIEFQVVFLQHLFGPNIRVVPILVGPYAHSVYLGGAPEDDEGVRRAVGTLGEIAAREGDRLLWVLGVDMAHIGRRYGDDLIATAGQGEMEIVARRDAERIRRMEVGDARGFWDLVQENHDDLNWCGSAPIYTFLKSVPGAHGKLLKYDQWNIDDQSVVTFAGVEFPSQ
jgi:hypothetical protein